MRRRRSNLFAGLDWPLVLCYCLFVGMGWVNIYAASSGSESWTLFNLSTDYGKQLIWIALSIPLAIVILLFDAKFYERFSSVFYLISIALLIGLFLFGKTVNGATSWYSLGNASLQPAEFAKSMTALAIARLLTDRQFNLQRLRSQLEVLAILAIPALLITLQPDPGSALIYTSFIMVLYREGLPSYYVLLGMAIVVLFLTTLFVGYFNMLLGIAAICTLTLLYLVIYQRKVLKKQWIKIVGICLISAIYVVSADLIFHQVFEQRHRDRINIVLGKNKDTESIGYNTHQSVKTIASGGLSGKGFLQGERTQGDFVPEQQTDYIFSTVGEEWGFLGTSLVVIMFTVFLCRIIWLSERQKNRFSRAYGYGIAGIFFFHF
ncbi:MAG: rod shape-determining protein RodA, partial [Lutibacter sp.]|nr:rod shape-determining protein RodA [Lutibacter sp.]